VRKRLRSEASRGGASTRRDCPKAVIGRLFRASFASDADRRRSCSPERSTLAPSGIAATAGVTRIEPKPGAERVDVDAVGHPDALSHQTVEVAKLLKLALVPFSDFSQISLGFKLSLDRRARGVNRAATARPQGRAPCRSGTPPQFVIGSAAASPQRNRLRPSLKRRYTALQRTGARRPCRALDLASRQHEKSVIVGALRGTRRLPKR
jgi:hypothetical protein